MRGGLSFTCPGYGCFPHLAEFSVGGKFQEYHQAHGQEGANYCYDEQGVFESRFPFGGDHGVRVVM